MVKGRKISRSRRILVSCYKNGKMWFIYHDKLNSPPIPCKNEQLAQTIRKIAREVGMIKSN